MRPPEDAVERLRKSESVLREYQEAADESRPHGNLRVSDKYALAANAHANIVRALRELGDYPPSVS